MQRILGIDYGRARVGIAISDELQLLAHPLETRRITNPAEAIKRVSALIRDHDIAAIVVGIPRHMSGSFGPAAQEAKAFCESLRSRVGCEVVEWDERLTTVAAQRALHETGRNSRTSRDVIDQVAAQMILQGYLDRLQQTPGNEQCGGD